MVISSSINSEKPMPKPMNQATGVRSPRTIALI
jgi:hypothetical protein